MMKLWASHQRLKQTNQAGFTLVELLIVMGLLTSFLLVLTDIVAMSLDVQTESSATSSVAQDGRFILARLSYDIEHASSITTPASLGATGPSLAMVVGGTAYTYALAGSNLQLTGGLGTHNLNGSESTISGLSIQRLGNVGGKDTIRATFTVTSKDRNAQGQRTQTFTTTVGRR